MKIDPETFLFSEFSTEEAESMLQWAEGTILGKATEVDPEFVRLWVDAWLQKNSDGARLALVVKATLLPARILLSILKERRYLIFGMDYEGNYGGIDDVVYAESGREDATKRAQELPDPFSVVFDRATGRVLDRIGDWEDKNGSPFVTDDILNGKEP